MNSAIPCEDSFRTTVMQMNDDHISDPSSPAARMMTFSGHPGVSTSGGFKISFQNLIN